MNKTLRNTIIGAGMLASAGLGALTQGIITEEHGPQIEIVESSMEGNFGLQINDQDEDLKEIVVIYKGHSAEKGWQTHSTTLKGPYEGKLSQMGGEKSQEFLNNTYNNSAKVIAIDENGNAASEGYTILSN